MRERYPSSPFWQNPYRVLGVLGFGYAALVGLPWIILYAAIPALVSYALGWAWVRMCSKGRNGGVSFERLAVLIPVSTLVIGVALFIGKPDWSIDAQTESAPESITFRVLREMDADSHKASRRHSGHGGLSRLEEAMQREQTPSMTGVRTGGTAAYLDSWNEFASRGKDWWHGIVFPFPRAQEWIGIRGPMNFRYEHEIGLAIFVLVFGAPMAFFFFAKNVWSQREHEVQLRYTEASAKLQAELERANAEIKKGQREFEDLRARANAKVGELKAEIERLRLREKYLTDGKPKPLEQTPQKPDLEFL